SRRCRSAKPTPGPPSAAGWPAAAGRAAGCPRPRTAGTTPTGRRGTRSRWPPPATGWAAAARRRSPVAPSAARSGRGYGSSRAPLRSRHAAGHLLPGQAEPAFAGGEVAYRRLERGPVEVRPQRGREPQFGVGQLPEQEIADPAVAAGADEQVRWREVGQGDPRADRGLVDLVGPQPPGGHVLGQRTRGGCHVLAPAVAGGNGQGEAAVAAGERLGGLHPRADVGREAGAVANEAHLDPAPVQLLDLAVERGQEQLHQRADLFLRPAPVLAGEGEQGQGPDALLQAVVDAHVDRPGPGAVADRARAAAARGP